MPWQTATMWERRSNLALRRIALPGLALLGLASPAHGVDGVLEIDQACAVHTGCFTGDTPGYPVTIDGSAGRSYRLTGDLVVPDENTTGIEIAAPDVSLDLNGFEIVRSGCVGATTNCTVLGSGSGIHASSLAHDISVRNGSIAGMGASGVYLEGDQDQVTNLRVRWSGTNGIFVGNSSTVAGSSAYQNGSGIVATSDSIITDDTANTNGGSGITAQGTGSTVSDNTATGNGGLGIFAYGATISGNTANGNGSDGIGTFSGCTVQGNTVRGNLQNGLGLSADSSYRGNTITSNIGGTVVGGINLGANSCNGTAACP